MFTGLVEATGLVRRVSAMPGGLRLEIEAELAVELRAGDSLAVNGVCLTVVDPSRGGFVAEVGPETARVTNLGTLASGAVVNLERPLRADSRLGGHFVLGHVDGTGRIRSTEAAEDFEWLTIEYPASLAPYFIPKGSVAVDGISLTVATLAADTFTVQIIPFTWQHTNLSTLGAGAAVNLECDMIGKYIVRLATLQTS